MLNSRRAHGTKIDGIQMSLNKALTALFFLVQLSLIAQSLEGIRLEPYLQRIERLIDRRLSENSENHTLETLLEKRSNVSGNDRVEVCLDLFIHYIYKSTELAKQYNDEAFELSAETGFKKGYLRATLNQAYILFVQGEFEKSLVLIRKVASDKELTNYPDIDVDCATFKSYIFTERGAYDIALETAVNLLERGEDLDEPYTLMRAYSAASHVYLRLGEYRKAMENCLKGLDYIIKLEKIQYIFPKIDEIARMTHKLEGSKRALEIYDFYLHIEKKMASPGGYIQSVVYMNIADIYTEESKFDKAKDFLDRALTIIAANNYRFRKPRAHVLMAKLYGKTEDIPKAIAHYHIALNSAQKINAFDVIKNVSTSLSELYLFKGDTISAASFAELHKSVSDSLFSTESEQRIKILEARRKISEISKEKEILEIRAEAQEERYRLILVVLVLTLISGGIAAYSYVKVKKKNELLYYRTKELALEKINQKKKMGVGSKKELVLQKTGTDSIYGGENLSFNESDDKGSDQSYIDEDVKSIILTKLERLENEHFFLDSKCSLGGLSDELQTNQKYLSQVINNEKKANFNNYINGLRINWLLDRLIEDREFRNSKLGYIAATSGFNNPNTFYSAFKKRLGILPSYFIKQLNEEEA